MAAVTICSDFGALKDKLCHCFHCFPIYLWWSDGTRCHDLLFFECWVLNVKSAFSVSSFTFIRRLFCSFSLSARRVVSSAYLKWKKRVKSVSHVHLFATPWTVAYQAPPSMEFSKQEYWNGVPCVICKSEVIDISPGNLDSSLCFIQPHVSHDVLCI